MQQLHSASKYHLKDLHQEIDFYDRKIAHCRDYGQFASEQDRAAELKKLATKRETLVKQAAEMAGRGIESDPKYLPRSLRKAEESRSAKSAA